MLRSFSLVSVKKHANAVCHETVSGVAVTLLTGAIYAVGRGVKGKFLSSKKRSFLSSSVLPSFYKFSNPALKERQGFVDRLNDFLSIDLAFIDRAQSHKDILFDLGSDMATISTDLSATPEESIGAAMIKNLIEGAALAEENPNYARLLVEVRSCIRSNKLNSFSASS
jgi:hypothetical protein